MKIKLLPVLAIFAVLSVAPRSGFAHHGSAAYDLTTVVTLKGTVTSLLWANPHTMLRFDSKDEKGAATHWALEMFNPLWMTRAGWTKDTLKAGDEIVATIHPAKNGSTNGYIHLPECKILFHGQSINLDESGPAADRSPATY
jgi:hypothetical protein